MRLTELEQRHERSRLMGRAKLMNGDACTEEGHRQRHLHLHRSLDELVAAYVYKTGKSVSMQSILDLMEWSHQQTLKPDTGEE